MVRITRELIGACVFVASVLMGSVSTFAAELEPNDARALAGLHSAKAVFDITTNNPKKLYFYLNLVEQTARSMQAEGVKPEFVLTFRGPATFYMSRDRSKISLEDSEMADKIEKKIAELGHISAVHMEQCAVAAKALHVERNTIYSPITVVGNSWISLIGYQAKGYALVPVR